MSDHMFQIPEPWEISKLPEIADINMGQSPSSSDVNEHGEGIVFFQGKAEFGKLYPTPKKYCTKPTKIASAGDILLSVRAPVGPTNLANQSTAIGRGLAAISAYHGLMESKYLLYFFKCIEPWLSTQGTGSTFKAISGQFIRDLQSPVPPLAEQKIIAEKLDTLLAQVDSTKARLEQIPQILKRFRQAVLGAATNGKLIGHKRQSFEEWTTKTLKDFFSCIDGDRGPNYPKKNDYLTDGHCLFLSTKNVRKLGFNFDAKVFISEEKDSLLRKGKLARNDLIITTRGTLGNIALYDEKIPYDNVRINSGMLILRKKQEENSSEFFKILFAAPFFQKEILRKKTGSAQPQLPANILKEFVLSIPPVKEQHEIVHRVEQLFAYADTIEKQVNNALARVNNLTQSILAKAFRGELTAQWRAENPELISGENSAAALLEKIKAERAASGGKKASRKKS
ncbi:TPA: restriction endonuclease subunit S [Escherichia coli]|uniref:4'-phosphopantetheinyl transferase n=1 Tax=Escherichia coli TaxID=562 RepID=A0A3F3NY76_ECOLX|nr:restriction endonuclease subunit S [Escherichia coli]EER0449304.1 4'-phosphopantetheinyl transferase [Escherichia coli]EER3337599.1 4'-phosphopantetheinyl transferase [Escherichia coli]EES5161701.1 4'-phosphopantetheinyl transferase [Escherichia coli]EEW7668392.1 4'-phosphopantetheinyl transferase [Escherichia coli]EEW8154443.1 4'-phosphopantetheinyl transferase [Escherichia coli]